MPRPGYRNLLRRYERYAPDYDQRFARYSEGTLNKALQLVPHDFAGDVLDVACGTGLFITKLRADRPHARITGIDISPQMLERARQRFNGDERVRFATGTAEHLPFDDASFDIIACNNAFHLVQDAPAALREFHRVLKSPGRVIIVDWCIDYPQIRVFDMFLRISDRQVRHIRSLQALSQLLQDARFAIAHRERFRVPPLWGLMAIAAHKA